VQREPGQISAKHWESLAGQCDVGARFLRQLLQETAASLLEQVGQTKASFEAQYAEYPSLQRIERVVTQQCCRAT